MVAGFFLSSGGAAAGWTSYPPLSALVGAETTHWPLGAAIALTFARHACDFQSQHAAHFVERACVVVEIPYDRFIRLHCVKSLQVVVLKGT